MSDFLLLRPHLPGRAAPAPEDPLAVTLAESLARPHTYTKQVRGGAGQEGGRAGESERQLGGEMTGGEGGGSGEWLLLASQSRVVVLLAIMFWEFLVCGGQALLVRVSPIGSIPTSNPLTLHHTP